MGITLKICTVRKKTLEYFYRSILKTNFLLHTGTGTWDAGRNFLSSRRLLSIFLVDPVDSLNLCPLFLPNPPSPSPLSPWRNFLPLLQAVTVAMNRLTSLLSSRTEQGLTRRRNLWSLPASEGCGGLLDRALVTSSAALFLALLWDWLFARSDLEIKRNQRIRHRFSAPEV